MKILLESSNLQEIQEVVGYGFIYGVNTNPSLISAEVLKGDNTKDLINKIIKLVNGEVHIQVTAFDYENIVKQASIIHSLGMNIIVKIPVTPEGMRAMKTLSEKSIKFNAISIYNPIQAMMASQNNAEYVTIQMDEYINRNPIGVMQSIRTMIKGENSKTKILAASIKNPLEMIYAGLDVDAVTFPYSIIKEIMGNPDTIQSAINYNENWNEIPEESRTFFNH